MDARLQHLILGTFLHDIGKVMQRAEAPVSAETERLMGSSGPSRDGRSSHYHVQWTSQFFEEHLGECGLPDVEEFEDKAARLAFRHHNPGTVLQNIVAEADRLSSGMDRGEVLYERNVHKRKRMVPVHTLLAPPREHPAEPFAHSPLCPLTSEDRSCYPISDGSADDESLVPEYKALWKRFLADLKERRAMGLEAVLARLDALYERHFWSVPASTIDKIPDSSLYAHSRTSAAVAAVLYLYHRDTDSLREDAVRNRHGSKFLLVAADLSGIQNYLFAIAHAGGGKVAKRLRARSFYLGRITQILAHQLVSDVGLPFINIILSAGGKFHLLLPNTDRAREILVKRGASCQEWLLESINSCASRFT